MGHTRGRRRGREKRTILILALIVCLLGTAILWARSRDLEALKPPPLTPDERARLEAPENAYNILSKATQSLSEVELPAWKPYPVPGKPGRTKFYDTEPDAIARDLDIRAPDDAPEVAQYLEECRPALDKAREALDAPYFLLPEIQDVTPRFRVDSLVTPFRASYRHAWEIEGDREEALDLLFDTIRLCRLLRQDGDTSYVWRMQSEEQHVWEYLKSYLAETEDAPTLNSILERQIRLQDPPPLPYERILRADWHAAWAQVEHLRDQGWFQGPGTLHYMMYIRSETRAIRALIEQGDRWTDLLSLPYPRLDEKLASGPADLLDDPKDYSNVAYDLWNCKFNETCCAAVQRQLLLLTLLEMHRRDRGEYPETLAEAVGKRLATVPEDPFTGAPFEYNPDTPERLLVSPGPRIYPRSRRYTGATWHVKIVNGVVDVQRVGHEE
jgi:hypothetical protein